MTDEESQEMEIREKLYPHIYHSYPYHPYCPCGAMPCEDLSDISKCTICEGIDSCVS